MERRATVKFQGEELEEWEALLEVERRKLKEDMEVWRHNNKIKNIQITQRTQTERKKNKEGYCRKACACPFQTARPTLLEFSRSID